MNIDIQNDYFEWIYNQCTVVLDKSYRKLLMRLHSITFEPLISMDENLAENGIGLRYKFGYNYNIPNEIIRDELDNRPCTCLEMMASLARTLGRELLLDPDNDDDDIPISNIFRDMLISSELISYDDKHFNIREVIDIIERCFSRNFNYDGLGGLFYIKNINKDMRNVEFWYQAQWFIDKYY